MPLLELLATSALSAVSQAVTANNENQAARRVNKLEAEEAKRQQARLDAEYKIQQDQQVAQYLWDVARTAQLRKVEAENALDTVKTGARVIESAANSLRINSQALYDKFQTEEALRATEVGMNYGYGQDKLSADTMFQVAQFLTETNARVAASSLLETQANRTRAELVGQIAAENQRDLMEWQMAQISALAQGAQAGARAAEGQGDGVTAQRLALDALQALGRQYEKVQLGLQDRQVKLNLAGMMDDETAQRMAIQAIEIDDYARRSQYALNRYGADSRLAQRQLQELTMPTFDLGQRQYRRELEGLQLQAKEQFDSAMTPYRRQEFFDPLRPIAGLPPMVAKPKSISEVGTGSVLAGIGISTGKAFLANAIDKNGSFKPGLGLNLL